MRWLISWLTCMLLAGTAAVQAAEVRDPHTHFFMPKMGDFKEELDTARRDGKQGVLIMFEIENCPFCERMKATVLNQARVQDWYRQHFLIYTLDVRGDIPLTDFRGRDTTEKAFALEQRVRATPTFIFFDLEGNAVTRFIGPTQTADEFLLLGRYVVERAYRSVPFNVYKRQHTRQ